MKVKPHSYGEVKMYEDQDKEVAYCPFGPYVWHVEPQEGIPEFIWYDLNNQSAAYGEACDYEEAVQSLSDYLEEEFHDLIVSTGHELDGRGPDELKILAPLAPAKRRAGLPESDERWLGVLGVTPGVTPPEDDTECAVAGYERLPIKFAHDPTTGIISNAERIDFSYFASVFVAHSVGIYATKDGKEAPIMVVPLTHKVSLATGVTLSFAPAGLVWDTKEVTPKERSFVFGSE